MKRILFLLTLLVVPFLLEAQDKQLAVRRFDLNPEDFRAKTDPVYDANHKPCARIEILFQSDKSVVFLPEGSERIELTIDGYAPFSYVVPAGKRLESARSYVLELYSVQKRSPKQAPKQAAPKRTAMRTPMRTLIMPTFSYNKSQYSYGLMLGFGGKNGGYVHAKSDFHFGLHPTLSCDAQGTVNGLTGWFTDKSYKSRFAVTAGYMRQLMDPLYVFAGGGYGNRILAWEMCNDAGGYDLVRVEPNSFTGFEAELGLIFRLGSFALSAGVQTNQFKYYEANIGLGILF